ncbi:MAG: GMC oxidoreductase [Vicinamibacterales bacterium]
MSRTHGGPRERTVTNQVYDAIVVGSGATGGWAAKRLAEAGLRVVLVEAGRQVDASELRAGHRPGYLLRQRQLSAASLLNHQVQSSCYAFLDTNHDWFVDDAANPYSTAADTPFVWHRLRVVGGRTMVWAGQSYRLADIDFHAAHDDGYGEAWPLTYDDLEPYYSEVERYMGVSGMAEGHPALPDGVFLPPMPMTCGEVMLRDTARRRFGRTVTVGRVAVLTRPHNGRAACRYCGPCEEGCPTASNFSSPSTTVADALATGSCTLVSDAVVAQIDLDPSTNRASGVTYVDRTTRRSRQVSARTVILCAQALESTRILLNSKTTEHASGLGNSSGTLGHYLMDHVSGAGATGVLPGLPSRVDAAAPYRPNGVYVVRFRNLPGRPRSTRFIRGYAFQGAASPTFNFTAPGIGAEYLEGVRDGVYSAWLAAFGESLPRYENYCEIDPDLRDAWGIPALRIHMTHGPNEHALMEDAAAAAAEMLDAVGARQIAVASQPRTPGASIHEVGTARMGHDRRTSVVDAENCLHDVRNVFVMDGACFVSSGSQNPTLTMMALAVRACDRLVERFRRGEV